MELHSIKWLDENTAIRRTGEVDLKCEIIPGADCDPVRILLTGTGDLKHHLVEDSAILLKKMAEVICGHG